MEKCDAMSNLSSSIFLQSSLIVCLLISLIAFPLLCWASIQLWTSKFTKLFHLNFRIILQMHLLGFLMHCFGRITQHTLDLYNYNTLEPCQMVPDIYRCFILRFFYNSGLWITNTTVIPLIIERWIATVKSESYENSTVWIGVYLIGIQLLITSIPLACLYAHTSFQQGIMFYCVAAKASLPYMSQISGLFSICTQILARTAFGYLHRMNEVQRLRGIDLKTSLSNKYQLETNITSIKCLKVFTQLSSIYLIIQNFGFITVMFFAAKVEQPNYIALLELNGHYQIYALATIYVMSSTISKIRQQIGAHLSMHVKTNNDEYFNILKRQLA